LRRHAEVVHRSGDHDDVGRLQFGDQCIALRDDRILFRAALVGRREERAEHRFVEVRQRVGQQVAHDDLGAGVRLLQLCRQFAGQQRGLRTLRARRGIDLQNGRHVRLQLDCAWSARVTPLCVATSSRKRGPATDCCISRTIGRRLGAARLRSAFQPGFPGVARGGRLRGRGQPVARDVRAVELQLHGPQLVAPERVDLDLSPGR
jgi:hypothetical protein